MKRDAVQVFKPASVRSREARPKRVQCWSLAGPFTGWLRDLSHSGRGTSMVMRLTSTAETMIAPGSEIACRLFSKSRIACRTSSSLTMVLTPFP